MIRTHWPFVFLSNCQSTEVNVSQKKNINLIRSYKNKTDPQRIEFECGIERCEAKTTSFSEFGAKTKAKPLFCVSQCR